MATIVVENGTIVANANSYVDLSFLTTYATDRGLTLPSTDADKTKLVMLAMDYLESLPFKGCIVDLDQALRWPRKYVSIDGRDVEEDAIPMLLKRALCQLVVEAHVGTPLFAKPVTSTTEGYVIEKTVGPLTKRFSDKGMASRNSRIVIASVEVYLKELVCSSTRTVRVL